MKKLMFVVMAAMAIGFTSCDSKKAQQAPADEVAAADSVAAFDLETAIGEATAQLSEPIEAKDANKLQHAIEAVQAKIAEILKQNPDAAKEYVAKVQDFLKENAEKIKEVVGDNAAVQAAVNALTAAPAESIVNSLMSTVEGAGEDIEQAGQDAVDAAKQAGQDAVDAANAAVENAAEAAKDAAKEKANEAIDAAANDAKKKLGL